MLNSASEFSFADCPGYAEAVAKENELRGGACLGINETICGCEVKPLNAAHIALLSLVRSPFLNMAAADIWQAVKDSEERRAQLQCDILRFLWIVSPQYQQGSKCSEIIPKPEMPKRKSFELPKKHRSRCAKIQADWEAKVIAAMTPRDKFNAAFAPILKQPVDEVLKECCQYVEDAYIDTDDTPPDALQKIGWAFQISIAVELSTHHGYRVDFWNADCPADKNPLFVPLKIVTQLRKYRQWRDGSPVKNRSDKFVQAYLDAMASTEGRQN